MRPWWRELSPSVRRGAAHGATAFMGSALDMEVANRLLEQARGDYGLPNGVLSSVEEFGEMAGAALLLSTLLGGAAPSAAHAVPDPRPT